MSEKELGAAPEPNAEPQVWFEFMDTGEEPIIKWLSEVLVMPVPGDDVGLSHGSMPETSDSFRLDSVIRVRHYWTPGGMQELHVLLGRHYSTSTLKSPNPVMEVGNDYVVLRSPSGKTYGVSFDNVGSQEVCNVTELEDNGRSHE